MPCWNVLVKSRVKIANPNMDILAEALRQMGVKIIHKTAYFMQVEVNGKIVLIDLMKDGFQLNSSDMTKQQLMELQKRGVQYYLAVTQILAYRKQGFSGGRIEEKDGKLRIQMSK